MTITDPKAAQQFAKDNRILMGGDFPAKRPSPRLFCKIVWTLLRGGSVIHRVAYQGGTLLLLDGSLVSSCIFDARPPGPVSEQDQNRQLLLAWLNSVDWTKEENQ